MDGYLKLAISLFKVWMIVSAVIGTIVVLLTLLDYFLPNLFPYDGYDDDTDIWGLDDEDMEPWAMSKDDPEAHSEKD